MTESTQTPEIIGVAVSTTGDDHRMAFLETSVDHWLRLGLEPVVTVDGTEDDLNRVQSIVGDRTLVYRVGQPTDGSPSGRLGVAANKNTGIELLMEDEVDHLILCDDDTYPLDWSAVNAHTGLGTPMHSMVNWGSSRMVRDRGQLRWNWPRGVLLYAHKSIIERVGGMIEEFGRGGHEHVEWSRRIHQAGLTHTLYPSPSYMTLHRGMGAITRWHAEDMPRVNPNGMVEPAGTLISRRRQITSIQRPEGYWDNAVEIMARMDGNPAFIPYTAEENGRLSASMSLNN